MPGEVDAGVDQGGSEDRVGLAPGPAVEEAGDGGEDSVTTVGEVRVGDVREPKEDGSGPPARKIAFGRAREHILQQAAEEELFGPSGEEENPERKKRERFPFPPLRRKLDEVHAHHNRNGDTSVTNQVHKQAITT